MFKNFLVIEVLKHKVGVARDACLRQIDNFAVTSVGIDHFGKIVSQFAYTTPEVLSSAVLSKSGILSPK